VWSAAPRIVAIRFWPAARAGRVRAVSSQVRPVRAFSATKSRCTSTPLAPADCLAAGPCRAGGQPASCRRNCRQRDTSLPLSLVVATPRFRRADASQRNRPIDVGRRVRAGVWKGMVAGAGSVAVMTLVEKLKQAVTNARTRVPAHTLERVPRPGRGRETNYSSTFCTRASTRSRPGQSPTPSVAGGVHDCRSHAPQPRTARAVLRDPARVTLAGSPTPQTAGLRWSSRWTRATRSASS
jgi:hypothetical protein